MVVVVVGGDIVVVVMIRSEKGKKKQCLMRESDTHVIGRNYLFNGIPFVIPGGDRWGFPSLSYGRVRMRCFNDPSLPDGTLKPKLLLLLLLWWWFWGLFGL